MSESDTKVQTGGQSIVTPGIATPPTPTATPVIPNVSLQQQTIDPKAKAFTDKLMELVTEAYNLSLELASLDDPNLLNHPVVKQARKIVQKVKELRDVLGAK